MPGSMTMTVEACCNGGRRLTYHITMGDTPTIMTLASPFDGSEVAVMVAGKPSGETMAITRVDDHHIATVVKMNGKPFGTSKATISPDGKTITVLNDFHPSGRWPAGWQVHRDLGEAVGRTPRERSPPCFWRFCS